MKTLKYASACNEFSFLLCRSPIDTLDVNDKIILSFIYQSHFIGKTKIYQYTLYNKLNLYAHIKKLMSFLF